MPRPLHDVFNALREIAPEHLAEAWDKVGLHVGDPSQQVSAGLLCIDLTEAVVEEAVAKGCQLIVAYHPPIFAPIERLTDDGPWTQRRIVKAVRAGIAVYSPHTALDAVRGGTNDWLCDGLGKASTRPPIVPHRDNEKLYKVAVYAPRDEATRLRRAMSNAGAGGIGRYSECSFNVEGLGTFRGDATTHPAVGEPGRLETVEETRVEMVCPADAVKAVLKAVRAAHPYEEPAVDVLRLADSLASAGEGERAGAGRVHHLVEPVTAATLAERVKQRLGVERVKLGVRPDLAGKATVRRIAVCVGSGGKLFDTYPGADAYVTGEMQHHQVLDLVQGGKAVVLAGHTNTERPYLPTYRDRLINAAGDVTWIVSETDRAPLTWT